MMAAHQDIQAQVLKVGHHGSKYSTSQAFLNAVKPKYAVISVGKGNRYGHPNDEVVNRLKENHIQIFRTDEMKTILATTDGNTIKFQSVPSLTPNGSSGSANVTPPSVQKTAPPKAGTAPKKTEPKPSQSTAAALKATLDDTTPQDYHTIRLTVTGVPGASYTAAVHYKLSTGKLRIFQLR
jgi:competence protein ComEC